MAADQKPSKTNQDKKSRNIKKSQTVRERASASDRKQPRRIKQTAANVATPLKKARAIGKKEFHLPLPDNKIGRLLGKRGRLTPKYIREAWQEIKQVAWPNRSETMRLTLAVFIFALVFAVIVGLLDYGLDKLFRNVILDINK
jgi:preprotein translocase SecE subunit